MPAFHSSKKQNEDIGPGTRSAPPRNQALNCRRVSNLLSAYLDAELAGTEMLDIRDHLSRCPSCAREYDELRQTKRLLGTLALRTPEAGTDFETRLRQSVAQQSAWGGLGRLPGMFSAWRQGATSLTPPRVRTLTTATALSVAGLLLGTITLDRAGVGMLTPRRGGTRMSESPAFFAALLPSPGYGVLPPYMAQHLVRQTAPPLADSNALMLSRPSRGDDFSATVSVPLPVQQLLFEKRPSNNSYEMYRGYPMRWAR